MHRNILPVLLHLLVACGLSACEQDAESRHLADTPQYLADEAGTVPMCIVTYHNKNNVEFADLTSDNHRTYARKHGYTYRRYSGRLSGANFRDPKRGGADHLYGGGLYWQKLTALQAMFAERDAQDQQRCDWAMWVDADVLFTNMHTRIEDVLTRWGEDGSKHAIFSREQLGRAPILNAGTFLVRNSPEGHGLLASLAAAYPTYKNRSWPEQDAMTDLAFQLDPSDTLPSVYQAVVPSLHPHVAMAPQRAINAFDRGKRNDPVAATWQPCDFVLHMVSTGASARARRAQAVAASPDVCNGPANWDDLD